MTRDPVVYDRELGAFGQRSELAKARELAEGLAEEDLRRLKRRWFLDHLEGEPRAGRSRRRRDPALAARRRKIARRSRRRNRR